jgi:hypothetical protein
MPEPEIFIKKTGLFWFSVLEVGMSKLRWPHLAKAASWNGG